MEIKNIIFIIYDLWIFITSYEIFMFDEQNEMFNLNIEKVTCMQIDKKEKDKNIH